MATLEKIRAEIENIKDFEIVNGALYVREYDVVQILDKYEKRQKCDTCYHNKTEFSVCQYCTDGDKYEEAEQNPSRDIKEIAEVIKSDVDAETKCKMISNILTAKPHYFAEQEPCDDAISREDELKLIYDFKEKHTEDREKHPINYGTLLDLIRLTRALSPVRPKEQTGHWRHYEGMLICSECGTEFYDDIMEYCGDDVPKCCPNCGAKMVEQRESEGKE